MTAADNPNPEEKPAVPAEPIPQPDEQPEPEEQPTAPRQPEAEPVKGEPIKGEIVQMADRRPEQPESTALDRAAEAAMAMPGVPGRDEFLTLAMTAKMLSLSGAAPKAIRNNPHIAFHVAMIGRDLGISPSAAIQQIDVIGEGDKATISLSPELLNGQVRRLGLGSVVPVVRTNDICIAVAVGPHGQVDDRCKAQALSSRTWPAHVDGCRCSGILGDTEFTWEDGQIAGLVGVDCSDPLHHSDKCGKYESADRFKCRQGWKTYPKRMLWWRAAGYCTADYFPEAGLGLYSPEEMGAVVDETGRPIDPTTVELPEGFEKALPAAGQSGGSSASDEDNNDPAPPEVLWDFQHRIAALPDEWQAELKTRWKNLHRLTGAHISKQPARNVNLINSVLNGVEKQAEAQKWDKGQALAAVTADLAACVAASVYTARFHGDGAVVDSQAAEGETAADQSSGDAEAQAAAVSEAKRLLRDADAAGVLDGLIAAVEPLKRAEVDRNLTKLHEIKTGDVNTAKQRLVIACLRWREQHDGQLPDLFGDDATPSTEATE